ncbi:MAG: hypothetical protein ABJF04_06110 [Reichenbachiella sp.]|uniref:hypothetical protein n=1 Tax=Reichenbachiella sp. TaxID=2184521 RepID=UPI0032664E48
MSNILDFLKRKPSKNLKQSPNDSGRIAELMKMGVEFQVHSIDLIGVENAVTPVSR